MSIKNYVSITPVLLQLHHPQSLLVGGVMGGHVLALHGLPGTDASLRAVVPAFCTAAPTASGGTFLINTPYVPAPRLLRLPCITLRQITADRTSRSPWLLVAGTSGWLR
ncbi:MAG TPA: hypothetical protein PLN86_17085, partial [Candidatus Hydrogenedentes bacterium]|nr:hypothetical protein [Candidatus Hydrogenedentota bacterium]